MAVTAKLVVLIAAAALSHPSAAFPTPPASRRRRNLPRPRPLAAATTATVVGPRIPIDETFEGLQRVHADPDVYVIENFLDEASCRDLIDAATAKGTLTQSPVAYAGWTTDFKDLVELAAKGPVTWFAILTAWLQMKDDAGASQIDLVVRMVQYFGILLAVAVVLIGAFTKYRADGLQEMRTSTSTTIDEVEGGAGTFVRRAAALFGGQGGGSSGGGGGESGTEAKVAASLFEAPTVIRYESGQVLAPHYDANRSAVTEDANRGGQTLATLLVYLNDVEEGGLTRFGKLPASAADGGSSSSTDESKLTVRPRLGDALLFFPADAAGMFDERTEHEGCPAVDEKWIARIWRHSDRVPPPFGLKDEALAKV